MTETVPGDEIRAPWGRAPCAPRQSSPGLCDRPIRVPSDAPPLHDERQGCAICGACRVHRRRGIPSEEPGLDRIPIRTDADR